MTRGFDSPTSALAAIVECLDGFCARVHVGTLGSGAALDCCPTCLLRVETAGLRTPDGAPRTLVNIPRGCRPVLLDVVINYRTCFASSTKAGAVKSIAQLTEQGSALVVSWWTVVERLSCCAGVSQLVRFVSLNDVEPDGNCAGWSMTLEADVSLCGCP